MPNMVSALPDPDLRPDFYQGVVAKRLAAWVVDVLLVLVVVLVVSVFTLFVALFFFPVVWMVVDFTYRSVTMARGSATLGQRLMGVEFRTKEGRKFDLFHAMLHTLGYMASMSFVLPQIASVILMLTGARGQSLTDHLLGTVAIRPVAESY